MRSARRQKKRKRPQPTELFGDHGRAAAAGDDGLEVVPAADDAAGVALDQLLQRDRHLLLDRARRVHVARNVEQLRARVALPAEADKPIATPTANRLPNKQKTVTSVT